MPDAPTPISSNEPPAPPKDGGADSAETAKGRVFPCLGCGADLTFHIGLQKLKCPFCGHTESIDLDPTAEVVEKDFTALIERLVELRGTHGADRERGLKEVSCNACGAKIRFTGTLTSSECAHCGGPVQLENAHQADNRVPTDGLLPFTVDRKTATKNLAAWVRSLWFAPNEFKRRGAHGKFNGLYLPYWTFDSLTHTQFSGMRGTTYMVTVGSGKNRRTVTRIRWTPVSGQFQRFFDDVLVPAAGKFPPDRIRDLEPWPLKDTVPFDEKMLAGLMAMTYDLPPDVGFIQAKQRIDSLIREEICQRIGGNLQKVLSVRTSVDAVTYKHLLLPLWMLAYRYKQKTFQILVNAVTGEVQGDRPFSWVKIALAVLAGTALATGIALFAASNS